MLAGTREILTGIRFAPDFDAILVLVGEVLQIRDETQFPEDMLHNRSRHHHPYIVPVRQPLPEQGLSISLIAMP